MSLLVLSFMLAVPVAFIGLVIMTALCSGYLRLALQVATSGFGLGLLGFFLFGFLASYEGPAEEGRPFRFVYGACFLLVSLAIFYVWIPRSNGSKTQADRSEISYPGS